MGQHKYNPTAIAAAKGELPPKPKKVGKREADRLLYAKFAEIVMRPLVNAYLMMHNVDPNGERRTDEK